MLEGESYLAQGTNKFIDEMVGIDGARVLYKHGEWT